jgi:tripartite-type tricarboxylate transporter receptor subunit TctC
MAGPSFGAVPGFCVEHASGEDNMRKPLPRKPALTLLSFLLSALGAIPLASAQDWPNHPMTLIVGFPPGGADDAIARLVAPRLAEKLGQPVNVENVGGRSGLVAGSRVAKAPPDGYEMMLGSSSIQAASQSVFKNPPFKSETDFSPVALLVEQPFIVIARKDFSAPNLQAFVVAAKNASGPVRYGSAGTGSATHLSCERFAQAVGIKAQHVPFNGGAPATQALLAGEIDYQCPIITLAVPKVKSGDVNGIAVLSRERSTALPGIASAQEQGLADFAATTWFALFLPAKSPLEIVQKLNAAAVAALDDPALQKSVAEIGGSVFAREQRSQDHLRNFLKAEIQKWSTTVAAAGISLD